jgi:hypothetical protein
MGDEKAPGFEESKYIHRKYDRVPDLDEIDQSDFVALAKARDQWVRDRQVYDDLINYFNMIILWVRATLWAGYVTVLPSPVVTYSKGWGFGNLYSIIPSFFFAVFKTFFQNYPGR